MTDIVQRRGRSPTAGELQNTLCGRSSDRRPCEDNGQPQTNIRYCDEPAHESLITDVSRRRSHPCTIIRIEMPRIRPQREQRCCAQTLTKDIRAYCAAPQQSAHYGLPPSRSALRGIPNPPKLAQRAKAGRPNAPYVFAAA